MMVNYNNSMRCSPRRIPVRAASIKKAPHWGCTAFASSRILMSCSTVGATTRAAVTFGGEANRAGFDSTYPHFMA